MSAPRKYTTDDGNLLEDGAVIAHTLPQVAVALANRLNNHAALVEAFTELLATVRGECPSLLNEDSGASAVLIDLVDKAEAALRKAGEGK